jgi:hypothetical protein
MPSPRVKILIEQIARYRVSGIKDVVIAAKIGMSNSGLSRILALPEYKEVEDAVLHGVVSKMDSAMAGKTEVLKDYCRQGVPVALRALLEACTQSRDLRARISAASELLDRDPDKNFVKGHTKLDDSANFGIGDKHLDGITEAADKASAAATVLETKTIQ